MDTHRPMLFYAPRARAATTRRWLRRAFFLALVITTLLSLGPARVQQPVYLFHQRRLLRHTLPPDTIVYESQRRSAEHLLQDGTRYTPPRNLTQLLPESGVTPRHALYHTALTDLILPRRDHDGIVYVHERTAPDGVKRLVVITMALRMRLASLEDHLELRAYLFEPATREPGSRIRRISEWRALYRLHATDDLRLFAGQSDPSDPSRFTIAYLFQGRPGVIRCRVEHSEILIEHAGRLSERACRDRAVTDELLDVIPCPNQPLGWSLFPAPHLDTICVCGVRLAEHDRQCPRIPQEMRVLFWSPRTGDVNATPSWLSWRPVGCARPLALRKLQPAEYKSEAQRLRALRASAANISSTVSQELPFVLSISAAAYGEAPAAPAQER